MNNIDVRTNGVSLNRIQSLGGMRFTIHTDGHNALYVQPMTDNWEREISDDPQYQRQNFPYTFKLKVSEKRNGAFVYTPQLSANFKRHYGTQIAWIVSRTLMRLGMRNER